MTLKRPLWILAAMIVVVVVVAIAPFNLYRYTKEGFMSQKIMMEYGPWKENSKPFDASRWFNSGMYQRRYFEDPHGKLEESQESMLRVNPMPFTHQQYEEMWTWAATGLEHSFPNLNTEALLNKDLSKRVRYALSSFEEPDKPLDWYNIYLQLAGLRYIVTFSRDAQSGEITPEGLMAVRIFDGHESDSDRKIFGEIEAAEKHP